MKFAIFLGHPAHFHLFKNAAEQLKARGHTVEFVIKQKDILSKCGWSPSNYERRNEISLEWKN